MKQLLLKTGTVAYVGLVVVALIATVSSARGDSSFSIYPIVQAINNFQTDFDNYAQKITQASSNYVNSVTQTSSLAILTDKVKDIPVDTGTQKLNTMLSNNILYVQNAATSAVPMAKLVPSSPNNAANAAGQFNAALYLNKEVLDNTTKQNSANFIGLIAGIGNPIQALPSYAYQNLSSNPSSAAFLSGLGSFTARESVGIAAIAQLIYERTPIKGLTTPDGNQASYLSFDAAMANARMQPNWRTNFLTNPKTTPGDLQRESVLIAAESRYELFQIRLQLEQLTAVTAAMQIGSEEISGKPLLLSARNEVIQANSPQTGSQ